MPTSKKPRKKYKPKVPPGYFELPVNIRHTNDAEIALQLFPQSELDKLRDGTSDDYTVNTLTFRLNWGYVMAGQLFDNPEVRADMELALAAIREVKARRERTGKWGVTGPEFAQIGDGLKHTDAMQLAATRREQRDAMRTVYAVNRLKRNGL
jgi:hypothetical protein